MDRLSHCKGKKFAVLGLGKSGLSALQALVESGAHVYAWDDNPQSRQQALEKGITLQDFSKSGLADFTALILSPGIAHSFPAPHPVIKQANEAGIPFYSDIELFLQTKPKARIIAVTGTNGKSTTTALIAHMLAQGGIPVAMGGNIGTPSLAMPWLPDTGYYVLELSSYQLELVPSLACHIAVLLNITPDHIARHGDLEGYITAKARIFAGQRQGDLALVGVDTPASHRLYQKVVQTNLCQVASLSARSHQKKGITVQDGLIYDAIWESGNRVLELGTMVNLPGQHNWENAAAAYAVGRKAGLSPDAIAQAFKSFPGLAHRQELIASHKGVRYVNDSKATNADAAAKALASYRDIYWILGGRAKEGGLTGLKAFAPFIRGAFIYGEAQKRFVQELKESAHEHIPISCFDTLGQATTAAHTAAQKEALDGAVVLLSPAAASFDQFTSFEARGDAFRQKVKDLLQVDNTFEKKEKTM